MVPQHIPVHPSHPQAWEGEKSADQTTPECDEELEDKLGSRSGAIEASVGVEKGSGGVVEAVVGFLQTSLQCVLVHHKNLGMSIEHLKHP